VQGVGVTSSVMMGMLGGGAGGLGGFAHWKQTAGRQHKPPQDMSK